LKRKLKGLSHRQLQERRVESRSRSECSSREIRINFYALMKPEIFAPIFNTASVARTCWISKAKPLNGYTQLQSVIYRLSEDVIMGCCKGNQEHLAILLVGQFSTIQISLWEESIISLNTQDYHEQLHLFRVMNGACCHKDEKAYKLTRTALTDAAAFTDYWILNELFNLPRMSSV
jgi:hypothetical protein